MTDDLKPKRGRPRKAAKFKPPPKRPKSIEAGQLIGAMVDEIQIAKLDRYARKHRHPTRSAALRQIIDSLPDED